MNLQPSWQSTDTIRLDLFVSAFPNTRSNDAISPSLCCAYDPPPATGPGWPLRPFADSRSGLAEPSSKGIRRPGHSQQVVAGKAIHLSATVMHLCTCSLPQGHGQQDSQDSQDFGLSKKSVSSCTTQVDSKLASQGLLYLFSSPDRPW